MAKTNLTVRLDEAVVRRARIVAARRGMSLSALVARQLIQLVTEDELYEAARRRAIALMDEATPHGGLTWTRYDLHADRLDLGGRRG